MSGSHNQQNTALFVLLMFVNTAVAEMYGSFFN